MAFPQVEATNSGGTSSDVSSFNAPLPASIADEDVLILIVGINATNRDINTPSGWTELLNDNANSQRTIIFIKEATGSEGSTVELTTTAFSNQFSTNSYRISGADINRVEADIFNSTSNSELPDPPSLTASWGSDDNLWIAACTTRGSNDTVDTYPSGFSNGFNDNQGQISCSSAERDEATATKDPGTFDMSDSSAWNGLTIAVGQKVITFIPQLTIY